MKEPFLSQFRDMIRQGAAVQDIHDAAAPVGYAAPQANIVDQYVEREVRRVEAHQRNLLPVLEHFVGPVTSILDVGCSTGGTTVALALSKLLQAQEVIGLDPNRRALEAAQIRLQGYDVPPDRLRFQAINPDEPLPFPDGRFDLTTNVSVLEFLSKPESRDALMAELLRVTKPGGSIYLATPIPWRLREFHSRRFLGDFRRRDGYPWSSPPSAIRRAFRTCERVPIDSFVVGDLLKRKGVPGAGLLARLSPLVSLALPWQKYLFRKPAAGR